MCNLRIVFKKSGGKEIVFHKVQQHKNKREGGRILLDCRGMNGRVNFKIYKYFSFNMSQR